MTIYLYDIAAFDPHGWILTLISVSVVFSALIILYGVYSLIGVLCSGRVRKKSSSPDEETAAAIALALELESGQTAGSTSSGKITITHRSIAWNNKEAGFRRKPEYHGKL